MNTRYKYIIILVLLIIFGIVLLKLDIKENKKVYHQHLEDKKEINVEKINEFYSNLPLVSIDTGGQEVPGMLRDGTTIVASISLYENGKLTNSLSDRPSKTTLANIRYRGNSSLHFDKKAYSLKCIKDDGSENDINFLGMGKHNEWILNGPYLDKTLIRNYMWYNISAEIMEYSPEVRFCELFVDGAYKGVYLLLETITRADNNRIDISKYDDSLNMTSYIVRLDRGASEIENLNNYTKYSLNIGSNLWIDVKYPGNEKLTAKVKRYIEEDLSKFEKSLYSFDYKNYSKYIDVDSFVNYFIINEFTQNYDAGNLSTYMYKDIRGKLKLAVWDFNSVCNNYENYITSDFDFQNDVWFEMLLRDPKFVNKIIDRYRELRKTYLNEEYLLNYIDKTVNYLADAVDRNFEVWGYTFLPEYDLLPEGRKIESYEAALEQYKSEIIKRGNWLDQNIERLHEFSHPSVNKKFNH